LHFERQWKYPWEHNSNIKREHGHVDWISNPWFGAMPYIPWWKSHNLVLYSWFTTMWNGTIRKCLVGESFEQCRNKEPIWFSKQRLNSYKCYCRGKVKIWKQMWEMQKKTKQWIMFEWGWWRQKFVEWWQEELMRVVRCYDNGKKNN